MIATKTPSLEEFLQIERDERGEFVRGEKIEKPLPGGTRSDLQTAFVVALADYGVELE